MGQIRLMDDSPSYRDIVRREGETFGEEAPMGDSPRDQVNIKGPEGETATVSRKAFENVYKSQGFTLAGATEADDGYEALTVAQLEEELESRGLPKTGNKAELIARLEEDDEED